MLGLATAMLAGMASAQAPGTRVLFDFEDPVEIQAIAAGSQNTSFDRSQDNAFSGRYSCRMTFRKGGDYAELCFSGDRKQGWQNYDYFAMDIFVPGQDRTGMTLEFMDAQSKNYATRCSIEGNLVVPGRQTLLIPITRLKRNNKEGRDWNELEPQDKIAVHALTRCKIHFTTPVDHDLIWFVDNIRLLKEDALGRKMTLSLPSGAAAFAFGKGPKISGFTGVRADAPSFASTPDLKDCGRSWPDPLTGNGVYSPSGKPFRFEAALPDGDYRIWVAAGMVLRKEIAGPRFLLRVGETTIMDDKPSPRELYGEKYFFRFMRTVYSERPNALWLDFIDRMYPVYEARAKASGGKLTVEACGVQLSALIACPEKDARAFAAMSRAIRDERMRVFHAVQKPYAPRPVARGAGDAATLCFVPDDMTAVTPNTAPGAAERARQSFDLAAAPGQNLIFRLGVSAFEDAGKCVVSISDLRGPGTIPASAVRWHLQDYRLRGADVVESALIPANEAPLEKGLTRCFWAWARVPVAAAPGAYGGGVTVTCGGKPSVFPVRLRVHPIRLESVLPYSFGMWYDAPLTPDPADRKRITLEQLRFMVDLGMTGVTVEGPGADGMPDTFVHELAMSAGMGRHPRQMSQSSALGMGRAIGRVRLGLGARIDQRPGCEFDRPEFKGLFIDSARKYAAFLRECGLPVAVQSVDEPRETPNPWNRNLEQTNLYGDWLKEAGVANTMVTPMGDANSGKDYTSLVDHHDIIATHAGRTSERLMTLTPERGKTLWLYNCGMDRLSWGFYNWRVGSLGRWEWHFRWHEDGGDNGYLNEEWYNPFTRLSAYAPEAPHAGYPGAMLYQSAFLTCADGITDAAYLYTLEQTLESARKNPGKAAVVARADALLAEIRRTIPFLPGVRGIASIDDGALVGQGLKTEAAGQCETWRRQIAAAIVELHSARPTTEAQKTQSPQSGGDNLGVLGDLVVKASLVGERPD
jgi:hypothetical protein